MRVKSVAGGLLLLALAACLASCGGGAADSSPSSPAFGREESSRRYVPHGRDERRAYHTVADLFRAQVATERAGPGDLRDAARLCALLSAGNRRLTIADARIAEGPRAKSQGCAEAMAYLVGQGGGGGSGPGRVIGIRVRGNLAMATMSEADGKTTRLPLVMQGGRWRLAVRR